ncbi:MAG: apolipoprotein N-acyltransferase [Anaerovoracaceae bacterium]
MTFICPLISAVLTAIAFSKEQLGIICLVSLVPLFLYILKDNKFITSVFLFQLFYHILLFYWLYELCPLDDFGLGKISSYVVISVVILILSLIVSIVFVIPFLICKKFLYGLSICQRTVVFAILFVLSEWLLQSMGTLSFPWGRIGTILYGYPRLLRLASIFGSLGMTLFILLVNLFISKAILGERIMWVIVTILLVCNFAWGNVEINVFDGEEKECNKIPVAIVQGGLGADQKWDTTKEATIERYISLSKRANKGTKIIVYPETAIPIDIVKNTKKAKVFKSFAKEFDTTLILGAYEQSGDKKYNALYAFTPDGKISKPQYKRILVPFGEYLPMANILSNFIPCKKYNMLAGDTAVALKIPEAKIGGLICYESIFPSIARKAVKEKNVDLLVVSSNDSWFGKSTALTQHFGHSVMRAVENGRCILHGANTGITAIIDQYGRVSCRAELLSPQILKGQCYCNSKKTIYSYIGDVVVLPGMIIVLYGIYISIKILIKNITNTLR